MVNFYLMRIKQGKLTLEDVPALWRDKVAAKMEAE